MLRAIESLTKQKIEVATVPTVAELRARRLDVTRASMRERILAGNLDDVRVVVDSLSQEFDIVNIAAAAVKLLHEAEAGDESERDIPTVSLQQGPRDRAERGDRAGRDAGRGPQRPGKVWAAGAQRPRDPRSGPDRGRGGETALGKW